MGKLIVLPPFFQDKGWTDYSELCHHVFWADASCPDKLQALVQWREEDGSKAGFFAKVGLAPKAPEHRPTSRHPRITAQGLGSISGPGCEV